MKKIKISLLLTLQGILLKCLCMLQEDHEIKPLNFHLVTSTETLQLKLRGVIWSFICQHIMSL